MLYLDNGPVAKSHVFQNVMQSLKVDWLTHTPAGKDGTRTTARSKGKVERPFRTVKEAHETVILLWGLFDEEMYVEFTGETWGPYYPVSRPVPLHRYRTFRRGKAAERADRIHALARQLNIPISPLMPENLNTTFPPLSRQTGYCRRADHSAGQNVG